MRLHPTQPATDLGLLGAFLVALGIALTQLTVLSLGAALLLGVYLVRSYLLVSIGKARAAGFEMVWLTGTRVIPTTRLGETELRFELRNRDDQPTWFSGLKMIASPLLEISVSPDSGMVPPNGSVTVSAYVRPLRVGHHGVHGLSLNALRSPALFECPLSFTSPIVVSVSPREERRTALRKNRGFSAERFAPSGTMHRPHEGEDFRELREHRSGDAFRKIAWKASARRGKLLVVETETRAPELAYLLVDISVEGWQGPAGQAPLDYGIDHVLGVAEALAARGDRVGLVLVAGRKKVVVEANHGSSAVRAIRKALAFETHQMDEDQSGWDVDEVRARVYSHVRTLDPQADQLVTADTEALLALVRRMEMDAPTAPPTPYSQSRKEALLRRYLLAFGVSSPPAAHGERHRTLQRLGEATVDLMKAKRPPSSLHYFLFAPLPEVPMNFLSALDMAKRRGATIDITPYSPAKREIPGSESLHPLEVEALERQGRAQFESSLSQLRRRGARAREVAERTEKSGA